VNVTDVDVVELRVAAVPPTVTLVMLARSDPDSTTDVPPAIGPATTESADAVGAPEL